MAQSLTIGGVARATNVTVETIRYYQRRGLLSQPAKPPSGRRHYSSDVVRQVRFLKRHGCDELQGFLYGEAIAPAEHAKLLERAKKKGRRA